MKLLNQWTRLAALSVCTVLLSASLHAPAHAQVSASKRAKIEELLNVTGALAIGRQMSATFVNELGKAIRANNPNVPKRVTDALPEEVDRIIAERMPALIELYVPLYDRYFTEEDLAGMIAFYKTEVGKKTIQVMPHLVRDSMQAGMQWGQSLGPVLTQRLRERFKADQIKI